MNPDSIHLDVPVSGAWASEVTGVYLHVPFCASDCAYCAFAREVPASRVEVAAYLDSLDAEVRYWRDRLGQRLRPTTLYIGGGTPTFLDPAEWDSVDTSLRRLVDPLRLEEVTVEANPESLTPERLRRLVSFGATRLSIGAQALAAETLALLDRTHDWRSVSDAVALARTCEELVVSLDLIYGIPGLSREMWSNTLDAVIALSPDHLSAYCLSYEEGTSLSKRRAAGRLEGQPDHLQRTAYDLLVERVEAAGLRRYEVSNFASARGRSLHNLGYWEGAQYLGLGPSAHSHVSGCRFRNHTRREPWQRALATGGGPVAELERVGDRELAAERLMRLRVTDGVPVALLPREDGAFWRRVRALEEEGLVRFVDPGDGGGGREAARAVRGSRCRPMRSFSRTGSHRTFCLRGTRMRRPRRARRERSVVRHESRARARLADGHAGR